MKGITGLIQNEKFNHFTQYKEVFGNEAFDMLHRFKIIEAILKNENKPHLFLQILKNFLYTIKSQDPTKFHYEIVRKALSKIDEKEQDNPYAVDLLARDFVETCNKFYKKLKIPNDLGKLINDCKKTDTHLSENILYHLDLIEYPESNDEFEKLFFADNGLSIWDNVYLKILSSIGPTGRKQSKRIAEGIKKNKDNWDPHFWFPNDKTINGDFIFHSPALIILASVLWDDNVKRRIQFYKNNIPALTTSIHNSMVKILSLKNKVIINKNHLQLFHRESLIGDIIIPTIPQRIFPCVFSGINKLNTVTGHRFTRHLIGRAFEKVISGQDDPRVLKLDRGATEISEQLGLKGKQHVTNIKEIIHAMAYLEFRDPQIAGNLIGLKKYKSPITGRIDEAYEITIGTILLPYKTFETYKNGECGLLIPLLKDPPLVGSTRSHAGQYLLQMNVMAEFSKQSIDLALEGGIQLHDNLWEEFAQLGGLTSEVLLKIKDRWIHDGDDGPKFLERIEDDFYTLGSEYQKELDFLKKQGELRIRRSNQGKASAIKQKNVKRGKSFKK